MGPKHHDKGVETKLVVLEPECDGLRVLARIIARLHLKKTSRVKEDGGTLDTIKW